MKKVKLTTLVVNTTLVIVILLALHFANAVPKPILSRWSFAFSRAAAVNGGVNVSWFGRTWDTGVKKKNAIKASDFQLLKYLGFKTIRLPLPPNTFNRITDSCKTRQVILMVF